MKLDYWELDYVHTRMKLYDIKFQEIYNELFDHIVTAIEQKRDTGDKDDIKLMYEEIMHAQFGGYLGIEKLAKAHESGYKSKVKKMIWNNYAYYINLKAFVFTLALILVSFELPHNKPTVVILFIVLFIAALFPSIYAYITLKRIKPSRGKTSLVYSHTITQANIPMLFLNAALWLPQLPHTFAETVPAFKLISIPLPVLTLVLALILIYDLSCMRLCRQELKQFVSIES